MKFKIQHPSNILQVNNFDGHILHFSVNIMYMQPYQEFLQSILYCQVNLVCDYCFYVEKQVVD